MQACRMDEILRTGDVLLIAALEPLLRAENIRFFVADAHMSDLGLSVGFAPRRLLVHEDDAPRARRLVAEAGYAAELRPEKPRA